MHDISNLHMMVNYIRGVYKVLDEEWQRSAKEIGLTQAEQHVIWIVYLEKEATITRIAEVGLWDISTVMQIIKRLKHKELVVVKKKINDRRISYVELTEEGQLKRQQSAQCSNKLYEFIKNYFDESETKDMTDFKEQSIELYRQINRRFHGTEFISWIEKTSKGMVNEK